MPIKATANGNELGYASPAILTALLDELIAGQVLTAAAAAAVLQRAEVSLKEAGEFVWVKGAVAIVQDVKADLANRGVP